MDPIIFAVQFAKVSVRYRQERMLTITLCAFIASMRFRTPYLVGGDMGVTCHAGQYTNGYISYCMTVVMYFDLEC